MAKKPYLLAAAVSVIFGFSFLFTKGALDYLTPNLLLALRFWMATLVLTALRLAGVIRFSFRGRPLGGIMALAFFQPIVYFICETAGVNLTSSSEAGLMIALIPIVVAMFAGIFLKERPSVLQAVCIVVSVAGVALIVLGGNAPGMEARSGHLLGLLALLGAVVSAAAYNILSRHLSDRFSPVEITFVMMWTGALFFTLLSLGEHVVAGRIADIWSELVQGLAHGGALLAVLYLGVLSSVVAFFCLNYTLSRIEASRAAVFANLTTVVSVVAGVLLRGEVFRWYHLAGGLLILAGVYGTNRFAAAGRTESGHPETRIAAEVP